MFAIAPLLPGFHSDIGNVWVGASPGVLVPPDPRRAILYVNNITNFNLFLWMTRTDIDPAAPHIVLGPDATLRFTWALDGPMSTFGWSAAFASGRNEVGIVEIQWLPEQWVQTMKDL